ncbi:MAG: hypothetical protein IKN43_01560 [Selenomonadaceae bacterium]|nr:hypothetical protein [Selenomonadaceae bacterium]
MNVGATEIINQGLSCLSYHLGAQKTEQFIAVMLRERFDYTRWRQTLIDEVKTFDDLDNFIDRTKTKAVFNGNPDVIL